MPRRIIKEAPLLLSDLARREACKAFEYPRKIILIGISYARRNTRNAFIRENKHFLCSFNLDARYIFKRRLARNAFKYAGKMRNAHAAVFRAFCYGHFLERSCFKAHYFIA